MVKKLEDTDGSITVMEENLSEQVDGVENINDDVTDLKENVSKKPREIFGKQVVNAAQYTQQENFTEISRDIITYEDDKLLRE